MRSGQEYGLKPETLDRRSYAHMTLCSKTERVYVQAKAGRKLLQCLCNQPQVSLSVTCIKQGSVAKKIWNADEHPHIVLRGLSSTPSRIMRAHRALRAAKGLGLQSAPRLRLQCLYAQASNQPLAPRDGSPRHFVGRRRCFSQSSRTMAAAAEAV